MSKTILLQRSAKGDDSSFGMFYLDPASQRPTCFIIEDEHRDVKVRGETRIDAGRYEVIKRITEESKMTLKYRKKYEWFDYHLMLLNTPRHKWIYIHSGNYESHTDGCLLVNFNAMMLDGEYAGGRSRDAYEVVYKEITKWLDEGERVFIIVKDEIEIVL